MSLLRSGSPDPFRTSQVNKGESTRKGLGLWVVYLFVLVHVNVEDCMTPTGGLIHVIAPHLSMF